jgi:hypothetical protein
MAYRYSGGLLEWNWGLGSIEIGSLDSINTLPFDHKSGSPESQLRLLPDINKPPIEPLSWLLNQ